jgi:hypothetical protein
VSEDFVPHPPTNAVSDPQVRAVLEALVRNMEISKDTFTDENAVRAVAARTVRQIFSGGPAVGGIPGQNPNLEAIEAAIEALSNEITNSLLFKKMGEAIQIDLSQYSIDKFPQLAAALGALNGAIIRETTVRLTNDESIITTVDAQGVRLDDAEAAIVTETTTRSTKDLALASAINNMWAKIGGATAVIDDGALASATPTSATATKWNSVVAAVTDPATGLVNSASIVQELDTYADANDNAMHALYTVRTQLSSGGNTVVGGFGLAASVSDSQGPTIDFGVLANKFWIGAPSSGYNPSTEYTANTSFPFIVVTTTTTIDGKSFPPGVYMKKASIGTLDAGAINTGTLDAGAGAFQVVFTGGTAGLVTAQNFLGYNSNFGSLFSPGDPALTATSNFASANAQIYGHVTSSTSSTSAHAIRGTNNYPGRVCSGLVGAANGKAFHAESGTAGPFTGSHDVAVRHGTTIEPGSIVVDQACLFRNGWSNTMFEAVASSGPNQKGAIGVFTRKIADMHLCPLISAVDGLTQVARARKTAAGKIVDDMDAPVPPNLGEVLGPPNFEAIKRDYYVAEVNSLGEGQVLVCGLGGDIAKGDLIVTSALPGKGMKQADDVVRSYTVAKSREAVTFANPNEVKTVACIYLCG